LINRGGKGGQGGSQKSCSIFQNVDREKKAPKKTGRWGGAKNNTDGRERKTRCLGRFLRGRGGGGGPRHGKELGKRTNQIPWDRERRRDKRAETISSPEKEKDTKRQGITENWR